MESFLNILCCSCLAAILLANDPEREILVIINNYTGDRLNFGLAIETARMTHGYKNIKMIINNDDCSIDNPRHSTGRRGLAGCSLINKIAGAMSSMGMRLDEIHDLLNDILSKQLIRTIGFVFHHDMSSNQLTNIEIGYGIHGEPGSMCIEREMNFKRIIDIIATKLQLTRFTSDVVLLFNNFGGASEYIFGAFVRQFIKSIAGLKVVKVYAGKFLTSLGREGLSITVMQVNDRKIMEYLEHPVEGSARHLFNEPFLICEPSVMDYEIPEKEFKVSSTSNIPNDQILITKRIIEKACKTAIEMRKLLNDIDSELGDGDTGTTLSRGAEILLAQLRENYLNIADPLLVLQQIGKILMTSMGGTLGAIISIFFQCSSKAFIGKNEHSIENWLQAITLGIEGIKQYGQADIGDRTLLDSLNTGCDCLERSVSDNKEPKMSLALKSFADGCNDGAEQTKNMRPKSGRAAYSVTDKESDYVFHSKYPDPGALAIANITREIFNELFCV